MAVPSQIAWLDGMAGGGGRGFILIAYSGFRVRMEHWRSLWWVLCSSQKVAGEPDSSWSSPASIWHLINHTACSCHPAFDPSHFNTHRPVVCFRWRVFVRSRIKLYLGSCVVLDPALWRVYINCRSIPAESMSRINLLVALETRVVFLFFFVFYNKFTISQQCSVFFFNHNK